MLFGEEKRGTGDACSPLLTPLATWRGFVYVAFVIDAYAGVLSAGGYPARCDGPGAVCPGAGPVQAPTLPLRTLRRGWWEDDRPGADVQRPVLR